MEAFNGIAFREDRDDQGLLSVGIRQQLLWREGSSQRTGGWLYRLHAAQIERMAAGRVSSLETDALQTEFIILVRVFQFERQIVEDVGVAL